LDAFIFLIFSFCIWMMRTTFYFSFLFSFFIFFFFFLFLPDVGRAPERS
jgi:hypothetical protein